VDNHERAVSEIATLQQGSIGSKRENRKNQSRAAFEELVDCRLNLLERLVWSRSRLQPPLAIDQEIAGYRAMSR
jgi:hypothetical protein